MITIQTLCKGCEFSEIVEYSPYDIRIRCHKIYDNSTAVLKPRRETDFFSSCRLNRFNIVPGQFSNIKFEKCPHLEKLKILIELDEL